jgi:DNA processing protein
VSIDKKRYWVAFHRVPYIGPVRLRRLLERFGDLETAWTASSSALSAVLDGRSREALLRVRGSLDLDALMTGLERDGIQVTTLECADYPRLLREIAAPPPLLYYRGTLPDPHEALVAVVGTRKASAYGREVATNIGAGLAKADVTVVSGMALGVDGIAHAAALDAGGRTIAVLGSGLNHLYPPANRRLAERIVNQGAVVSDYVPEQRVEAANFPPRNRIISGLSLGVVVVEAPDRSGALITVDFAADQGRDVFVVPGNVRSSTSAGCNRLLRDGARLVRSADDIIEDLRLGTSVPTETQQELPLGEDDRRLLALLTHEAQHIDEVAAAADQPIAQVSAQLVMLELQGFVRNAGAQHYARV